MRKSRSPPFGKRFKRVIVASDGEPDTEHADLPVRERGCVGIRLPVAQPGCAGAIDDIHVLLVTEIAGAVQIQAERRRLVGALFYRRIERG